MAYLYRYVILGLFASETAVEGMPALLCFQLGGMNEQLRLRTYTPQNMGARLPPLSLSWVNRILATVCTASTDEDLDHAFQQMTNLSIGPLRTMADGIFESESLLPDAVSFSGALRFVAKRTQHLLDCDDSIAWWDTSFA